ncbi:MAG TPA: hypothetical protein VLJ61_06550 [Pyrinomonadaceae bacterium]|nr:hypothetical protein [Pyrinomonadaceae bacterium]
MATPERINKVALVLDSDFGERLLSMASDRHIWVIDTPRNRVVAAEYWARNSGPKVENGITTFKVLEDDSALERCLGILQTIDLHHGEYSSDPPYSILEVIGLPLSYEVESALRELDFRTFETTDQGFLAKK